MDHGHDVHHVEDEPCAHTLSAYLTPAGKARHEKPPDHDVHHVEDEPCAHTLSAYLTPAGERRQETAPATPRECSLQPIDEETLFAQQEFGEPFSVDIPRVSPAQVCIGIANYNLGRFLRRCIRSLQAQTLTDWRCIIVDDGSTDGSELLYDMFEDERISVIRLPANLGQPVAKSVTIEFAKQNQCSYWTYVDPDDWLPPDSLAVRVRALTDNAEYDAIFGRLHYVLNDRLVADDQVPQSQYLAMRQSPAFQNGMPLEQALLECEGNVIPGATVMARVPALETMDETFCLAPDYELWQRLLRKGRKFGFVDTHVYYYYRHEDALSAGLSRQKKTPFEIAQIRAFSAKVRAKANGSASARRLRVAVIDLYTGVGGAQLYFASMVRQLRDSHDFFFLVRERDQTLVPMYESLGHVVTVGHDLVRTLKENAIDLVHCWNGLHIEPCLADLDLPLLHHVQGRHGYTGRKWSKLDFRIFVSEELAELYHDVTPVPQAVLPNAIPVAEVNRLVVDREGLRTALGIDEGTLALIWLGRIVPVKNVPFLLALLDRLRRCVRTKLICVGTSWSDDLNEEFVTEVGARNLQEHVIWIKGVAPYRVPCLLKAADVFVLPSHSEGLSLAMLEAMAARVPVVVSAVGGHVNTIVDGQNGYVRPLDLDAFVSAIMEMATQPALRDRIVRNAFRTVCLDHDIGQNARTVDSIYTQILADKC